MCVAALAFATNTFGGLVRGWQAICLALYYFVSSWFWPWYLLWSLAAAGLTPGAALSRLTIFLSWGVLLLYGAMGFAETDGWYLQTYRSLAAFGIPLVLILLDGFGRLAVASGRWARRRPVPAFAGATSEVRSYSAEE
jgi:hypothetical protein